MTVWIPGPIWKMAKRDITRNRRRWFASVALISLPIAAGVFATAATISGDSHRGFQSHEYLNARTVLSAGASDDYPGLVLSIDDLERGRAEIVRRFGEPSLEIVEMWVDSPHTTFTFVDFAHPMAAGHSPLTEGRLPEVGEVMVKGSDSEALGDTVVVPGLGARQVVGIYRSSWWRGIISPELPPEFSEATEVNVRFLYPRQLAVADPGLQVPLVDEAGLLYGWWASEPPVDYRFGFFASASLYGAEVTAGLATFVALMVIAVFVVRVRSQLRELGLVAAAGGGGGGHMFLLYVVTGGIVGVVAAVIGATLGAASAGVIFRWGINAADYFSVAPNPDLRWIRPEFLAPMLVGLLGSIAASVFAAVQASRISVLDALNSYIPSRKPWRFSGAAGMSFLLVGFIFAARSWNETSGVGIAFGAVAAIGLLVGIGSLGVAGISALEHAIPNLPLWIRLAVRDANRHRARSGLAAAAISMVMLATGLSLIDFVEPLFLLLPVALAVTVGLFVYLSMSEVDRTVGLVLAIGAAPRSRKLYAGATALVLVVAAAIPVVPAFGLLVMFSGNPVARSSVAAAGLGVGLVCIPVLVGLLSSPRSDHRLARV